MIEYQGPMASALDKGDVAAGRNIGFVEVTRSGKDVVHDVTFAFAFKAFRPNGVIHTE